MYFSVHAGKSGDAHAQYWFAHDTLGYRIAMESFTKFAASYGQRHPSGSAPVILESPLACHTNKSNEEASSVSARSAVPPAPIEVPDALNSAPLDLANMSAAAAVPSVAVAVPITPAAAPATPAAAAPATPAAAASATPAAAPATLDVEPAPPAAASATVAAAAAAIPTALVASTTTLTNKNGMDSLPASPADVEGVRNFVRSLAYAGSLPSSPPLYRPSSPDYIFVSSDTEAEGPVVPPRAVASFIKTEPPEEPVGTAQTGDGPSTHQEVSQRAGVLAEEELWKKVDEAVRQAIPSARSAPAGEPMPGASFLRHPWGAPWRSLVVDWQLWSQGAPVGTLPQRDSRPAGVSSWIKNARRLDAGFVSKDQATFGDVERWWQDLKPQPDANQQCSWATLDVNGPMGLILVLGSMVFWRKAMDDARNGVAKDEQRFASVANDITAAIYKIMDSRQTADPAIRTRNGPGAKKRAPKAREVIAMPPTPPATQPSTSTQRGGKRKADMLSDEGAGSTRRPQPKRRVNTKA
jgi:hypothetical protein